MLKRIISIGMIMLLLGLFTQDLHAQKTQKQAKAQEPFISKLSFGGYLGLQFGSYTNINVSPQVTYRATNWLYPGIGFTYMYFKDNRFVPAYTNSFYGPRFYASIYVWRDLYAHVEWEALNVEFYDGDGQRGYIHNILLGGGYRQWIGQRSFMQFSILFNVNESLYSPYSNPIIRIGFGGSF